MRFGKTILGLYVERKLKVNLKLDNSNSYSIAPLCKYDKGCCVCKRILNAGPVKCVYKKGPENCCFEKEQPADILAKSKTNEEEIIDLISAPVQEERDISVHVDGMQLSYDDLHFVINTVKLGVRNNKELNEIGMNICFKFGCITSITRASEYEYNVYLMEC